MTPSSTIFLISPANLGGKRGKMIMNPEASFELARALRAPTGAPLGEVFSFVSGLYFRGKMLYAEHFGRAANGGEASAVITAGGGLCSLRERLTLTRLRDWQRVAVDDRNPHFTAPLQRHASLLLDAHGDDARFVLLGSVANDKYVAPLLEVFGARLFFPERFRSLGDMSRGALLLRAVKEQRELTYAPVADLARNA